MPTQAAVVQEVPVINTVPTVNEQVVNPAVNMMPTQTAVVQEAPLINTVPTVNEQVVVPASTQVVSNNENWQL